MHQEPEYMSFVDISPPNCRPLRGKHAFDQMSCTVLCGKVQGKEVFIGIFLVADNVKHIEGENISHLTGALLKIQSCTYD